MALTRDEVNARQRAYRRTKGRWQAYWAMKRYGAKQKGIPFSLTVEQLKEMIESTPVCPILGIELAMPTSRERGRRHATSPSLHRLVPALGYVVGNVIVVSWRANDLLKDATPEELLKLAGWIQSTYEALIKPEMPQRHGGDERQPPENKC